MTDNTKTSRYLELSPDEMVDLLSTFQKMAREMAESAITSPYEEKRHIKACTDLINKAKWLARQGDVI